MLASIENISKYRHRHQHAAASAISKIAKSGMAYLALAQQRHRGWGGRRNEMK
jgi:hypothetical protein